MRFILDLLFCLSLSINVGYARTKYLLVEVYGSSVENTNSTYHLVNTREIASEKFLKTDESGKSLSSFGLFRRATRYPVTVELKETVIERCKNEKLKAKKSFTIERHADTKFSQIPNFPITYEFTAVLDNVKLSELSAQSGGKCNEVVTNDGSERCGLSTTLMEYCFTDDKVGGIDLEKDELFNQDPLKEYRQMAKKTCKHIVYLNCAATPLIACSAYFTAAINTKHTLMFTTSDTTDTDSDEELVANVFDVAEAQPEFKEDAIDWVNTNGRNWYFCKCKTKGKKCTVL